jgi:chemotaxis signal transduction protein
MSELEKLAIKHAFDWETTKRRLTDTVEDLRIPEPVQELLQKHARAIGLTMPPAVEPSQQTHLGFVSGRLPMAVSLDHVWAVFAPWRTAQVPGAPAHLSETVIFQGRAVPLLNLDTTSGLRMGAEASARGHVILLETARRFLGLRCDEVLGPLYVDERELSPNAPEIGSFVRGVTPDQVLVLNVPELVESVTAIKVLR